ncbi:MAG: tRNA (cytidine(34)-2'-O)-methyltransferase [Clostridia bacterium]|nr:tRNA (cytidine(34)-2'-O)-methyltransferase [Clostridia bacterium]
MALDLNIALVEPRIPANAGNIVRTCAVTGCGLHMVRPLGFEMDDKKLKRAGLDYWEYADIKYYDSVDELMEKYPDYQFYFATTKGEHLYSDIAYPEKCFILFGREDAGLPEELLRKHRDQDIRIPMRPGIRSLNLSNSVAIILYEALRQHGFPEGNFVPETRIFED